MKRVTATALARRLGDILGRVRYRGESFEVERNGVVVARIEPVRPPGSGRLTDALRAWRDAGEPEPDFADALERVGAADREPANPWG